MATTKAAAARAATRAESWKDKETSGRGRLRRCSGIKTANAKAVRSASNQARKIDSGSLAWHRALRYKGSISNGASLFINNFQKHKEL